ncbi:hypothetical protein [Pseudomonas amygdali]|uniref:Uncharacterized protein n=3 Tax=Pseudomonas amygdali TaxID=47877 RepID=A0ABR5KRY9_PSEAV|nr:hypothetical protein [Pseudomonas amygdali]AXH59990.1 hypothetical protein PLA107_032710 [Pseudomonas amygdali pv. lachrymans str. M301315]KPC17394.1 Uncharacterized protein AC499_0596 [Pseudomonas amygdali pv. lachrymans]
MLPTSLPEALENPVPSTHPIHQIRALIAEAKQAIWECVGPELLEPMLSTIAQRISELPALGNPQAISPLTQQFLSLIVTKPRDDLKPDGQTVLVMVKYLGYTDEFLKIYSRLIPKEVLGTIVEFMANDPLLIADLKSARMLTHLSRRGFSLALGTLLNRMLAQKCEPSGPSLLEALNICIADPDVDVFAICDIIRTHRDYLWAIPEFKAKTAGAVGVGFLSPKAALTLYQFGEVDLAREVVKVMCRQASDPNHYFYLNAMSEAPSPAYFNERFEKRQIFCEDVLYSIQNPELDLPLEALEAKQNDNQLIHKIIDRLPQLHVDSEVQQDRMIKVMQALSATHPGNQQKLAKGALPRAMLMRVDAIRDIVFAADLGL